MLSPHYSQAPAQRSQVVARPLSPCPHTLLPTCPFFPYPSRHDLRVLTSSLPINHCLTIPHHITNHQHLLIHETLADPMKHHSPDRFSLVSFSLSAMSAVT